MKTFLSSAFLVLAILCPFALATAGEANIDLTAKPQIYLSKEVTWEAVPDASGSGVRFNYSFENAGGSGNWINCQYQIPAIESLKKITIVAKGTVANTAFVIRNAKDGKTISYRFGPVTDEDFQTFELDPAMPIPNSNAKNVTIDYPITKILIQIRPKSDPKGFLEISKSTLQTNYPRAMRAMHWIKAASRPQSQEETFWLSPSCCWAGSFSGFSSHTRTLRRHLFNRRHDLRGDFVRRSVVVDLERRFHRHRQIHPGFQQLELLFMKGLAETADDHSDHHRLAVLDDDGGPFPARRKRRGRPLGKGQHPAGSQGPSNAANVG